MHARVTQPIRYDSQPSTASENTMHDKEYSDPKEGVGLIVSVIE